MRASAAGAGQPPGGQQRAEEMIEALRRKHDIKPPGSKALPAKSTVGIVLEGLMVNIIVPGSPAFKEVDGERIEPRDTVKAIDGKKVTEKDIIQRLRGPDVPGSKVKLTIVKGEGADGKGAKGRELDISLTRADMRSVMNVKDLYMALGELNSVARNPTAEELVPLVDALEVCVQSATDWMSASQQAAQALAHELEELVRQLAAEAEEASLLRGELDRTRREAEAAKGTAEELAASNRRLQEQASLSLSQASEAGREEIQRAMSAARATEEQLKHLVEAERGKAAEAARGLAAAQDALRRAEAERDAARSSARAGQQEADELARSLRAAQGLEGRVGEEARRAEVAEQAAAYLKEQMRDLQERANHADFQLQRELNRAKETDAEVQRAKREAEMSKEDLRTCLEGQDLLMNRMRLLQDEIESRDGKDKQVRALRTENEHLRQTLDSLREERREGRETIAAQHSELQTLRDTLFLHEQKGREVESLVPRDKGGSREGELRRKLYVAEKEVAALERELKHVREEARAQAAGPGGGKKQGGGARLFNARTDDVWEAIGLTGVSFMAGSVIKGLTEPSELRDTALFASGVLFFIFLALSIFKATVAVLKRCFPAPRQHGGSLHYISLPEHTPLSLPEHSPLLTDGIPDGYTEQRSSSKSVRHAGTTEIEVYAVECAEASRRSGGIGAENGREHLGLGPGSVGGGLDGMFRTWTGSVRLSTKASAARGQSRPASAAGGAGGSRPQSGAGRLSAGGARLAALKGNSSYGTVDFSLV